MSLKPASVVIVGAGFSGTITAAHLARQGCGHPMRITLVDSSASFGLGLAYQFSNDNLLLNVPAGNMSAFADEPAHFVTYCQSIDPSISERSFVSRRLYGSYLQSTLAQAKAHQPGVIETIASQAVALQRLQDSGGFELTLANGARIPADHVVLAMGHQPPRLPIACNQAAMRHIVNAWDFNTLRQRPTDQPVMLLGTGHTAVDTLFSLTEETRQQPVVMVSRHGALPHGHRLNPHPPQAPQFTGYLNNQPATVRDYFRALRQEIARQASDGVDWRDVLNALRPHTPGIWQSWPTHERRRFLRHLQTSWDTHRHRLAPVAAHRLHTLMVGGQAQVVAGRIVSIESHTRGLRVAVRPRGTNSCSYFDVSALVNCSGPNADLRGSANPLIQHLLGSGLIQADELGMGLRVTPDHQVLDAHHRRVPSLWYVGPMLKADRWEATAVPELRVHTHQLAQALMASLQSTPTPSPT
jgi:uncharacterized NAD(P)/FAD-binding protein YdhS